ncbi:hypothetical protein ACHAPT_009456 [Fusarium lateritium]
MVNLFYRPLQALLLPLSTLLVISGLLTGRFVIDEHRGRSGIVGAAARPARPARPLLPSRLDGCKSKIEELMRIAGTPRLAFGVYKQGEPTYFANFGYRDVEGHFPVYEETIFPGCSLTKVLFAMTLGRAVDEDKLTWDTRVKYLLSGFEIGD